MICVSSGASVAVKMFEVLIRLETLGLVGLGSIARAVAKHASNLGMRVIAVRENPGKGSPQGV